MQSFDQRELPTSSRYQKIERRSDQLEECRAAGRFKTYNGTWIEIFSEWDLPKNQNGRGQPAGKSGTRRVETAKSNWNPGAIGNQTGA